MKKFTFVLAGIISSFVLFAVLAGVFAFLITLLANSVSSLSPSISMLIGIGSEIIKWGLSIYGGIKVYKILVKKYFIPSSNTNNPVSQ